MLISEFDELMEARPFLPFRMITADGRTLLVRSPEFAWRPPGKSDLRVVWVASEGERVHMVDLHWVTQFVIGLGDKRGRGPRKRAS